MLKDKEKQAQAADAKRPAQQGLLFISHANPQDNAVAAWFATQLTLLGYEVWCDLKNTHGGESAFWLKVQKKIEEDAAKFIFILSDTSRDLEKKRGVYKELQTADNLARDNFIIPLRVERLSGRTPILINPDIYINAENWMSGLRELCERLEHDGVPKTNSPDLGRISSWWPALSAHEALVQSKENEIVSNVLPFKALPEKIHFLKVSSEKNPLTGYERLRKALPAHPAHSAHSDYAISFGCAHDYMELTHGLEMEDAIVLRTVDFLSHGHPPLGIAPETARNILTYLIASALEKYLGDRDLSHKAPGRGPRKIWYPASGLIRNNRHSICEPGKRKAPVTFVGERKHFKKTYFWHFGILPVIDLHTHNGIILNPKAVITLPYKSAEGEKPKPIDDKKVLKKLGWWNDDWRRRILGISAWLADDQVSIRIPTGYQDIVVASGPRIFTGERAYREVKDDALIEELLEVLWSND